MKRTALGIFQLISKIDQKEVEKSVFEHVGMTYEPKSLSLDDVIGGDENSSVLRAMLADWWAQKADISDIMKIIDRTGDPFAREMAILVCAEACSAIRDDVRLIDCCNARLAWAKKEALNIERDNAIRSANVVANANFINVQYRLPLWHSAGAAASSQLNVAAASAVDSWAPASKAPTKKTLWDSLARPLTLLYPLPYQIEVEVGLLNWEEASSVARWAIGKVVGKK